MTTVRYVGWWHDARRGLRPFLQLQLCTYKVQLHVQVCFLLHLLSCCDNDISVALIVGVVLFSALSSICGAVVLVVLPGQLDKVQ